LSLEDLWPNSPTLSIPSPFNPALFGKSCSERCPAPLLPHLVDLRSWDLMKIFSKIALPFLAVSSQREENVTSIICSDFTSHTD